MEPDVTQTPRRRTLWRFLPLALLAVLLLAGCADNAPNDTMDPAGPAARDIYNLSEPVFLAAIVIFFLVEGVAIFIVFKFRRRAGDDEVPAQTHGNTKLEIGWTILPAIVLAVISVPTVVSVFDLFEKPENALEVSVTGQQWWWSYEYDDYMIDGTDTPVVTANELHIPAGQPVSLELRSKDVIHSFWSPRLNGKRDVVPGRVHTWKIEADEPGRYAGQCTEFCGASHANMLLTVVAHSPADWEEWIAGQQEVREPLVAGTDTEAGSGDTGDTGGSANTGGETEEDTQQGDQAAPGQAPGENQAGGASEGTDTESLTPEQQGFQLFGSRGCAGCHVVNGSYDDVAASSPSAPDLTHLFSRRCFAGCMFELNQNQLEAWLRNPPDRKPGSLMPNLGLTEAEIDQLIAYLKTLE